MGNNRHSEAAVASIQRRQGRLQVLDEERDQLVREIQGLEIAVAAFQDDYSVIKNTPNVHLDDDEPITRRVQRCAYTLLQEERPLHRKELMYRVEAMGIEIVGKDKLRAFASYINPDKRFTSVEGMRGYWTLVEELMGQKERSQLNLIQ